MYESNSSFVKSEYIHNFSTIGVQLLLLLLLGYGFRLLSTAAVEMELQ